MLRFGVNRSLGLRLLQFVCSVFGFYLPTRGSSTKRRRIFLRLFGATMTLVFVGQSLFSLYMALCFTVDSYITGVIYAVNIITILKHLFCVVYFELNRHHITSIYAELQIILDKYNYPFVDLRTTCRKITLFSVFFYLCLPALFILLMRTNTISSIGNFGDDFDNSSARVPQVLHLNETLSTVRRDFHRFFNLHSENLFRAAMVISAASNLRVVAATGLLLAAYLIVAEQLRVLATCLTNILYPEQHQQVLFVKIKVQDDSCAGRLEVWQEYQQHLARILDRINTIASPVTVISICCHVALLTLSAFAVTKMLSDLIYATNFMTGCVLYLIEIYLFCEVGNKIKRQADNLANVIHHGPWLALDYKLVSTVHFLAVDCQRSFLAKGGPFFTLSLEFFATVVSAVFTYFIVAIQIK